VWLNLVFLIHSSVVAGYSSNTPAIELPDSPHSITLGETSMLQCSVLVEGLNAYSAWHLNGSDYDFIDENPLCDNSTEVCTYVIT